MAQNVKFTLKRITGTLIILTILLSCNRENDPEVINILWAGSSSTYMHEMPLQMEEWLNRYDSATEYSCDLVGRSGTGFHDYLKPDFEPQYGLEEGQNLFEKIREEKPDLVVLQMITYFLNGKDSLEIMEATALLVDSIRNAGGEPVFFEMGWDNDSINKKGRKMSRELAELHKIKYYAPCSEAWHTVREEKPDIELFNLPDSDHPGTYGNYLNMSCLFKAITNHLPDPAPEQIRSWPRFGSFDRDSASRKLDTTNIASFHEDHPEFIQRMSVMQYDSEIPGTIRDYLRAVAERMEY